MLIKKRIKRRDKRDFILIFSMLLFIFLYQLGYISWKRVSVNYSVVSARYDTAVISGSKMKNLINNNKKNPYRSIPDITLWNRLKNEVITNQAGDIRIKTNMNEVSGDMSRIIPMSFIQGNYVYPFDRKGCVLDSTTAYGLFGTIEALNNIVIWKNQEFIIRGIVKAKDKMMLIQVPEENHNYANLEAVYSSQNNNSIDNQGQLLKDFLVQSGLPAPEAVLDGDFTVKILWDVYLLPYTVAILLIAAYIMIRFIMIRKPVYLDLVFGTIIAFLLFILIKRTLVPIHIPSQLIPTKWSDFDFYVNKYKELQEYLTTLKDIKLMPKDEVIQDYQNKCIFITVVNSALLAVIYFNIKKRLKQ